MRFLEIILENSQLKEAKIYNAAKKAAKDPNIGITIHNKSAYYVIRDCANITLIYLPHFVFGGYEDPFASLSGKFTKAEIQQFISETERNPFMKQLLDIILCKGVAILANINNEPITSNFNIADPYGEYGGNYEQGNTAVDTNLNKPALEKLCELFNVMK